MLDKVYWLRKSCTRDIVAIVSNNLLFTSLQISDEPKKSVFQGKDPDGRHMKFNLLMKKLLYYFYYFSVLDNYIHTLFYVLLWSACDVEDLFFAVGF